ncbi:TIGR01777 family oxidoreductase [Actinophytocola gossypii]|uniref:TIGR01777 family oxidoreductase n=1 Tax=Actinophytocola gossypii TaxID=2812003 RepID=A0ABT2JJV3_9PSEU|nr:TIGR01777 family oxidoreductase [Actinophytocola gossypii]MCT2588162.1 TIGR01777 family oxidoreductase [Actinophytocola gossypii]
MHVAVTGSTGLIGHALIHHLRDAGDRVVRLVQRRPSAPDEVLWYPELDTEGLAGVQAVVHLVGEPVHGRWTEHHKESIRESRVGGTGALASALAAMEDGPRTLLCASSVGYYGDRGEEVLTEASGPGEGFLASVHREAEEAAAVADRAGLRVVHLRLGIVQSAEGGALAYLLPRFRRGLGIRAGAGGQWVSWVSLPDVVRAVSHVLVTPTLAGPVNVVAPHPVANREYADILAAVLGRPRFLALTRGLTRRMFGVEVAEQIVLASTRAVPERLLASGFTFRHATLEAAFRDLLDTYYLR